MKNQSKALEVLRCQRPLITAFAAQALIIFLAQKDSYNNIQKFAHHVRNSL